MIKKIASPQMGIRNDGLIEGIASPQSIGIRNDELIGEIALFQNGIRNDGLFAGWF